MMKPDQTMEGMTTMCTVASTIIRFERVWIVFLSRIFPHD